MPVVIDNILLDETNVEFNHAVDFIKHTDRLVYLTGKAGTGKTTFLKYLKQASNKNTVIVAPTGVAAINAGGQTIHSFFLIKPGLYFPDDKRLRVSAGFQDTDKSTIYDHFKIHKERLDLIRKMQLLIIDEISMVRCDLLDVIDRLLRVYRKRMFEPFGGVQVVLIGDTFQLPPIADGEQWEILSRFYESPFFFSAAVIKDHKPIYIELKKIYRQREPDFIDLLNRVRVNQVSQLELDRLNSKYDPVFTPPGNSNYITLATHNKIVDSTNLTRLAELPAEQKTFEATTTGNFPDNMMPTEKTLQLKEGAQIMFIKNDKQKRFYNGKVVKIKSIVDNQIIVEFVAGDEIVVEKETWENIRYAWNEKEKQVEEEVMGTFTQFPVKLAWAVTVHKSQGLTFENVIADLGGAFASGQVYVALSRCTSFDGLVLKTRIERNAIKADPDALKFAENETPGTLINHELNSGKADYYYKRSREAIKAGDFVGAFDQFNEAIKFRNDLHTDTFRRYMAAMAARIQAAMAQQDQVAVRLKEKMTELERSGSGQLRQIPESKNAIKKLNERLERITNQSAHKSTLLLEAENQIAILKNELALASKKIAQEQAITGT